MKIGDGMYKPTRRDFLKLLGAGAAWALLGCAQPQKPAATPTPTPTPTPKPTPTPPKELKIGIISFRAGPAAAFGVPAHNN
mgnify:CR=1 FL=1